MPKVVRTKAKARVRLVSELVSEEDRFYVRTYPIVDVRQPKLTDAQIQEIVNSVKEDIQKELQK